MTEEPLACSACGKTGDTGTANGWRAPLGRKDDDTIVVCVMCSACADDLDANTAD